MKNRHCRVLFYKPLIKHNRKAKIMSHLQFIEKAKVSAGTDKIESLIEYVQILHRHIQHNAHLTQSMLPELSYAPHALMGPGPKYPVQPFSYFDELNRPEDEMPVSDAELLNDVARFFRGAIRPESSNFLFNMVPEPGIAATAGAWLATAYNINSLMDAFGGEALLTEQRVARRIGRWAGWEKAMGIACNGGKLTILYAIKSAISRISPDSRSAGVPDDLVILCSEGAHYCVEHAASMLGIGSSKCLRVVSNREGRMCPDALTRILNEQHTRGRKVAAIICSGGTTINFNCEDTREIVDIAEAFSKENNLKKRPYLHLDSVIGWLYLSLRDAVNSSFLSHISSSNIRDRITQVHYRLRGIDSFDSMGVDFHKNGLCPYASSFFIASDHRFMDELGDSSYCYNDKDFNYGHFRAYRYTLENSRPAQGILSAWINLRKLGRQGYADYLIQLHAGREALTRAIELHGLFKVLNRTSLGWEVIFDIPFDPDVIALTPSRDELAVSFIEECWERVNAGYDLPLFSIVPGYRIENDPDNVTSAFLLYPMKLRKDTVWYEIVSLIASQFYDFQTRLRKGHKKIGHNHFIRPIR